jgi:hypothetical protein
MKLEAEFVQIDFYPVRDLIYSGFVLFQNEDILILNNYNKSKNLFDGFTIFRTKEICAYRVWGKSKVRKIEKNSSTENIQNFKVEKELNFYKCLKKLEDNILISFFSNDNSNSYKVAKIIKLGKKKVTLLLVDANGYWTRVKVMKLSKIDYFSFMTTYEKKVQKKINRNYSY